MMSSQNASQNRFLTGSPTRLFIVNAVPMMVIMAMSGLLTVVDAVFLGHFVGASALAAVSTVFPLLMVTIALSTLVSGGMSSLLARRLGAGDLRRAQAVFAQAHGLALCIAALMMLAFWVAGRLLIDELAGGARDVAQMAYTFLAITVCAMPVQLLLAVHGDTWRNEGRAGLIALLSCAVTLANIALNYGLIVGLNLGVAGSAWGTALAQTFGLALLVGLRSRTTVGLTLGGLARARWWGGWRAILALGAPVSLSFLGIALVAAMVITTLRLTTGPDFAQTVAAYGIVTRLFSFTFLPLMAIALATQSIVGNNYGAGLYDRTYSTLRLSLGVAFAYSLLVEISLLSMGETIGRWFVAEPGVVLRVAEILRPMVACYLFSGPVLVLALYFQAIGEPAQSAALSLTKPFLLSPLLIAALGSLSGAGAIWFAFPIADSIILGIALMILIMHRGAQQASKNSALPGHP
jgi:putative MATE family efflux protein